MKGARGNRCFQVLVSHSFCNKLLQVGELKTAINFHIGMVLNIGIDWAVASVSTGAPLTAH